MPPIDLEVLAQLRGVVLGAIRVLARALEQQNGRADARLRLRHGKVVPAERALDLRFLCRAHALALRARFDRLLRRLGGGAAVVRVAEERWLVRAASL